MGWRGKGKEDERRLESRGWKCMEHMMVKRERVQTLLNVMLFDVKCRWLFSKITISVWCQVFVARRNKVARRAGRIDRGTHTPLCAV